MRNNGEGPLNNSGLNGHQIVDATPAIVIAEDAGHLAEITAEFFAVAAARCVRQRKRFMTALSGGATPRKFHGLLATERFCERIPWGNIHLFWVDERCVDVSDESSNYGSARKDFIDKVDIPGNQVHPMPILSDPVKAAAEYWKTIVSVFEPGPGEKPVFDCIFLGMGTDGHTGSLFPGQESEWDIREMVLAVRGGVPDVQRLTMSIPLLNRARHLVFIVSGRGKAERVRDVFACPGANLPVQRIKPVCGSATWLLDRAASELMPSGIRSKASLIARKDIQPF